MQILLTALFCHEIFIGCSPSIVSQKARLFFFHKMTLVVLVFKLIQNNFVTLYCDSCHISVHLKNQNGEFLCSHFNTEDGRKYTFWHIMIYYFKKGKNATEMQKQICAVYRESAVTDQTCQK